MRIILSPHNSLTRLSVCIIAFVVFSFFILFSSLWFSVGAWPVSVFMGVEYFALCMLLFIFYKKRKVKEDVLINDDKIIYRYLEEEKIKQHFYFNSYWTKIIFWKKDNKSQLFLLESGKKLEMGKFLHTKKKEEVYKNINNYLKK